MSETQQSERETSFHAPAGKITSKLPVFYNPAMTNNRDLSVLILKALASKRKRGWKISLPLAASGIRGIRIWKEVGERLIRQLAMNDGNPAACDLMRKNLAKNAIDDDRVEVSNRRAVPFLLEGGADYIDVDPFGFPGPFLDAACKKISRDGILAVTATDTGALCGSYPKAGGRKYWAKGLRNMFMHETGLRILARRVQLIAAQYDRAAVPIFSYAKDHYMRIFFEMQKGRSRADKVLAEHGWIAYCEECTSWEIAREGSPLHGKCDCGEGVQTGGPMFLGSLWDSQLVKQIQESNEFEDLQSLLDLIAGECRIPTVGFYDLHEVAKKGGVHNIPKRDAVIEALRATGNEASATHFAGTGIRTTADVATLLSVMQN